MKNNFWHQTASIGFIIGALSIALVFINYLLGDVIQLSEKGQVIVATLLNFLKFVVLFSLLWSSSVRYARLFPKGEYSFGQGLGFVVMTMVFAGFFAGIGYYIQYVKLNPDYIPELVAQLPFDENVAQATLTLLSSIVYWIMVAVFQMAFFGSILGIIISLIIRRKHSIIGYDKEELSQENNSDETIQ